MSEAQKRQQGVVGYSADGCPIVTAGHICPNWKRQPGALLSRRECWYCAWSDFRKDTADNLTRSICHCPENRRKKETT